jgi:2-polyprenyl-3-methyl-5-hydroxy-6-metoxy-1,4-benzoquinol methylase
MNDSNGKKRKYTSAQKYSSARKYSSAMSTTINQCVLCGHHQSSLFDERMFRGVPITNRLCSHCGLVFQSPRPSDQDLQKFYEEEYRQVYQGDSGPSQKDLFIQRGRADSLLAFVRNQDIEPKLHLDIGCSAGLLLSKFQEAFQTLPCGIEPGKAYREYAKSQGLEVFSSIEELGKNRSERFDLISLAHVLEHISEPVQYLSSLREKWLTMDGNLLVEVPNLYGHDCFEIAHLVSYSIHTLKQTLQQAGYAIQATQVHGRPRSQILHLYLTILAKPSEISPPINPIPERNVKLKRKMGILKRQILTQLSPQKAWLPKYSSAETNHK